MTMTNAAPAPPAFLLLRGGELYAPEKLGRRDLLIGGERILAIAEHLEAPNLPGCQEIDARGLTLCPGLIDQHLHLIGGGGEAGPHSRTPEVRLSSLLEGGITTVVGLLGTDAITRHPESLLAKARSKDPNAGYATDFPDVIARLAPTIKANRIRVVTNAGGVNPQACRDALQAKLGL